MQFIRRAFGRGSQAVPWNSEESIREELFSIERLEQHAESLAAAGSALVSGAGGDDPALAIDLDGGSLFLTRGNELMLVVLADSAVAQDPLANVMLESVAALDEQIAG